MNHSNTDHNRIKHYNTSVVTKQFAKTVFTFNRYICKMDGLTQRSPVLLLHAHCPAKLSSNPKTNNQCLQATLKTSRQAYWGKVKLNSDAVVKFNKIVMNPSRFSLTMKFQRHLVSSLKSTCILLGPHWIYLIFIW